MQRHNRFFAERLAAEVVELSVAEAHHAAHVLRLKQGDPVALFDGQGGQAGGEIAEVRRGKVAVRILQRGKAESRPTPRVHLAFAAPKSKRLDWLLEKVTELAAASMTPVAFEHSVADPGQLAGAKRERWLSHCVAAAKQSGLNWLPELRAPLALAAYLRNRLGDQAIGLAGSAAPGAASLRDALADLQPGGIEDIHVLVGPEGGITDAEYAAAEAAGFIPARLGATTLRVETACVAMIAAVTALLR